MKRWRVLLVLALAAVLLCLLAVVVSSQTTKHYDGHCTEDDLHSDVCYPIADPEFVGLDTARPVTAMDVFTAALSTVHVTVAANGYICPSNATFYLRLQPGNQTIDTWLFSTSAGVTNEYEHDFTVEIGSTYDFYIQTAGSGCGWVEWVDVDGVQGEEPTPTPEAGGCINDDPDLESGGADWTDIGSPEWLTDTVLLDQGDGFYQTVSLQPGGYTVHITATTDPGNLDYKPITVSLGYTETAQRVELWGVEYVNFAISEAGTYTLTVESDYDDLEYQLELGRVCLMAVSCINDNPPITNDAYWSTFGTPKPEIMPGGGVTLTYLAGISQGVIVPAGAYRLEISATLTPDFPPDRAFVEMCLGSGCAMVPIITDTYTTAQFNVLSGGNYPLKISNLSTSRLFPTNTITLTYACLNPVDNTCVVVDPNLDAVSIPGAAGQQGWTTVYDDVAQPGGASIACQDSVEQWVYLESGTYTGTLHAHSSFVFDDLWSEPYPVSGTLTIRLGPEADPSNDFRDFLLPIHSVGISDDFGMSYLNRVYTFTLQVPQAGNYLLTFQNLSCLDSWAEVRLGSFWLDYVCLVDQSGGVPGLGYCASLIDASFQEYEAAHWDKTAGVSWSPGYVSLATGAAISQTVLYSSTAEMTNTTWIVYAVAKTTYTATLGLALGENEDLVTVTPGGDFAIYTATITSSMPISVALTALTGTVDLDFVCVYDPANVPGGEWGNGSDGDTECIEPELPPGGLPFFDAVEAWLAFIVDWIKYLICLMVLWLQRIWAALKNFLKNIVIDLGLDVFLQNVIAWLIGLLQGPYDLAKLGEYVLNLMFDMAARAFALLFTGATLAFLFFSSILVGLALLGSLLAGFWAALGSPCGPESYQVAGILVQGFLLVERTITQIDAINTLQYLLIGVMGLSIALWTFSQFKTMTGGGE